MKKRIRILCMLIITVMLCVACGKESSQGSDTGTASGKESAFETNEELFELVMDSWKNHSTESIYEYLGKELKALMSKEDFTSVFEKLSALGGEMLNVSEPQVTNSFGTDVYTTVVEFENVTLDWNVSMRTMQINGFTYNIHLRMPLRFVMRIILWRNILLLRRMAVS